MSETQFSPLRYRQVHLDFHTSEHIPNIGRDFDAKNFVSKLKDAHVDSITLFARCHHGWCYYPSEIGAPHPELARPDLLGEMVTACRDADIETPIYITVQWDENLARTRPEFLGMSGTNSAPNNRPSDGSANYQLSASWHTLCLNNPEYVDYLVDMGLEVARLYNPPGLFYDIVSAFDCVCPKCVASMQAAGLDPESAQDRRTNDNAVNEAFRQKISTAVWKEHADMRLFFNCGHIDKLGRKRFETYSHLELESLPTGQWGYDHFPVSARYAAALDMDFLGQTGKFHTSWGEFGGFKQKDALVYECGQMVAFGAKCMVGDQLHPLGHINADTYELIGAAYEHIAKLEPYLVDAQHVKETAILTSEYFASGESSFNRNHAGDEGASRMMMELKRPFDIIDPTMSFDGYKLIILPDNTPVDNGLKTRLDEFVSSGGKLILSNTAGQHPDSGKLVIDAGVELTGDVVANDPSYVKMRGTDYADGIPASATVMYGAAQECHATTAKVIADCLPSYFDRSYAHFCSHLHSPANNDASILGAAVTLTDNVGYFAYPIFEMYQNVGQPIYKYLLQDMLNALIQTPALQTSLPSAGRATLTEQARKNRKIVHLLYGGPQVRGRRAPDTFKPRQMEMIEDIPCLADIEVSVSCDQKPSRIFDALSGENISFAYKDGRAEFTLAKLHIHRVIVVEDGA